MAHVSFYLSLVVNTWIRADNMNPLNILNSLILQKNSFENQYKEYSFAKKRMQIQRIRDYNRIGHPMQTHTKLIFRETERAMTNPRLCTKSSCQDAPTSAREKYFLWRVKYS